MLKEGDVLKKRYKVTQLIGKGGMSSVYLGTDLKLSNKLWAIKEVNKNAKDQAGRPIEQSLAMEANLLSKLDHPMIVDIVDIITTDKYIYVVMDYVEGKSLDKVVREEGPQSEEDVQNWMMQICDALDYLHKQNPPIIYRDMKPSNIMLRPDGYVKLIDLGVAREYKDQSKKDTIAFGTEGYAPPEQYGKAQTDPRADIYALGATMWHLLTGEAPQEYPLPDIRIKNPKVREGFAHVIVPKCCQLDRELRYQDCDELLADLEIYQELTREYYTKQKHKVDVFIRLLLASVSCLLAGFIFLGVGNIVVERNYETQKTVALNAANDVNTREEAFKEAIACKPGDKEAYQLLIKFYQEETGQGSEDMPVLSHDNLQSLNDLVSKYTNDLKRSGQLPDVDYAIGKAIWDTYDDGSNNTDVLIRDSAMRLAKPYFEQARDNKPSTAIWNNSDMYIAIANSNDLFTNSSTKSTKSFDDDGVNSATDSNTSIDEYMNGLDRLLENLDTTDSSKVKLNTYATIQYALRKIADNTQVFKSNNVSLNRLEKLKSRTYDGLNKIPPIPNSSYESARGMCLQSLMKAWSDICVQYGSSSVGNK